MFLLAILDSTGFPLVGGVDALVVLLAAANHGAVWMVASMATLGSLLGSLLLFAIARKGGTAYLARYTSSGRGARFKKWFEHYGLVTVFVPAAVPIPLPMKVFVLSAGAMEVSPASFCIVLLAARIPRYFILAWMGTQLGPQTLPFLKAHIGWLALIAVALCLLLVGVIRLIDRRRAAAVQS